MSLQPLHPAYLESGPLRPQRGRLGEACAYLLLAAGLVASAAGLIVLAGSWMLWIVLALLIALPRLANLALAGALLGTLVILFPGTEDISQNWPLALAVLVPVPLAAVIDRNFFRR